MRNFSASMFESILGKDEKEWSMPACTIPFHTVRNRFGNRKAMPVEANSSL